MNVAARVAVTHAVPVPRAIPHAEKLLLLFFLLSLPLVNPWVRGDGVGYYAYARALIVQHNLRFEEDWRSGNASFVMYRTDEAGRVRPDQYTKTGYLDNHFAVGPAMLWAPFLTLIHLAVLGANQLGAHISANGFSRPYMVTIALATATYGFLGIFLSFCLARKYFQERWAFLATVGIWLASSLPVYMYFNTSWSPAHSAFVVGLFLWYWHKTREGRTLKQWSVLGLISGLMLDVYYANVVFLLVPLLEAIRDYWRAGHERSNARAVGRLFAPHALYAAMTVLAFLPTLITRQIIYGSPLHFGAYTTMHWHWTTPALLSVLFSSDHGLLVWTPILVLAVLGLVFLGRHDPDLAAKLACVALALYILIAFYPNWDGLSSFGNRFFISLTPVFVLGLAASLQRFGKLFESARRGFAAASLITALFVLWNAGFIFQWGTHLVPARGPISWREMAYNQVAVVPERLTDTLKTYLVRRRVLMERIEQQDLKQLQSERPKDD